MKYRINSLTICAALYPLGGYGDYADGEWDDWERFANLNPNDESAMRSVIKEYFLPFYARHYTQEDMSLIKEALMYFLTTDNFDWERECTSP